MTERGLPLADGAPACPFVAFDDDRDERSSVPDHRHRCFAEQHPAPRALAHQEAYCLSSAFPVCPTFQDWARREAAHSRDAGRRGGAAVSAAAANGDVEERGTAAPPVVAPDLAAAASAATVDAGDEAPGEAAERIREVGARDDAASFDDRPARPAPDGLAQRNPPRDWAAPPPWLTSGERSRGGDDSEAPSFLGRRGAEPGQGLAGSAADRMAGGYVAPAQPERSHDEEEWTSAARPAGTASRASRPQARETQDLDEDGDLVDDEPRRSSRRPRAYAQHLGGPDGPDWERPRRYEAYPTIRTRVGLPGGRVPPILTMAGLVAVAALALFFLPGLLNFGGGGGPVGSAAPSLGAAQPSVSLAPTTPPEPTPELYTIKKGETLSKIATAHGLTLEELLAANPAIKNPNKISEGQQIIIPVPGEEPPETVGESTTP